MILGSEGDFSQNFKEGSQMLYTYIICNDVVLKKNTTSWIYYFKWSTFNYFLWQVFPHSKFTLILCAINKQIKTKKLSKSYLLIFDYHQKRSCGIILVLHKRIFRWTDKILGLRP